MGAKIEESSLNISLCKSFSPYTSSVLTWINLLTVSKLFFIHSRILCVPRTLVCVKLVELLNELSTWVSAAKWKTVSKDPILKILFKLSLSFILQLIKLVVGGILLILEQYSNESKMVRWQFLYSFIISSATWEPINPAPPVSNIFLGTKIN